MSDQLRIEVKFDRRQPSNRRSNHHYGDDDYSDGDYDEPITAEGELSPSAVHAAVASIACGGNAVHEEETSPVAEPIQQPEQIQQWTESQAIPQVNQNYEVRLLREKVSKSNYFKGNPSRLNYVNI